MFPEIHIGFTGTQEGMTVHQMAVLSDQLKLIMRSSLSETTYWFHHGDCIGADEQAHKIARRIGWKIHLHPPIISDKRAFCDYDLIEIEKEYLVRNKDIVNAVSYMYATPKETEEQLRSGTWSTIRYAKRIFKPLTIIFPFDKTTS